MEDFLHGELTRQAVRYRIFSLMSGTNPQIGLFVNMD